MFFVCSDKSGDSGELVMKVNRGILAILVNLVNIVNMVILVMFSISVKLLMINNLSRNPLISERGGWVGVKTSHSVKYNLIEYRFSF